jgi:hypothetical protein
MVRLRERVLEVHAAFLCIGAPERVRFGPVLNYRKWDEQALC